MIETFAGRIEFWQDKARRDRERLNFAEGMVKQLRIEATGFEVGEVVEAKRLGKWEPAIIREIDASMTFSMWFRVSFKKANGEWANRVNSAYSDVRKIEGAA